MLMKVNMEEKMILFLQWFSVWLIWWCAYLGIDHIAFPLYWILMIFDYLTWILKWFKNKNLRSKTATMWFLYKILIMILIFSVAIAWKTAWYEMKTIMSWLMTWLALAELYSILANIYEFRTWKKVTEFDAVTGLILLIMDNIRKRIENIDKKEK